MKKSSILVLLCCVLVLPTFSAAVGVFDKTADWTLATSKNKAPGSITAAGTGDAAVYTVKGNGDDIWNNADEGFFAYTAKTGSFSIQAKVKWVNPGDNWGANAANYEWAKVGVMIRDKADDPASRHFSLDQRAGSATKADLFSVQMRQSTGGGCRNLDTSEAYPDGVWLRVSRYAPFNFFWAEYSEDGKAWTLINTNAAIPMGDSVGVGLCIANHYDDTTLAEATVSEVKITDLTAVPTSVIGPAIGDFDGQLDVGTIGVVADPAKYDAAKKTYTVSGSGDDIWNNADAFHYVYKKVKGAFEAEAEYQITSAGDGTWSKAGLMVRENLGTSASNAFALIRTDNQFAMAGRATFEGSSSDSTYTADHYNRFKVVKVGSTVSGFMWNDTDKKWVLHSSKPIPISDENFVGLAVTAHNTSLMCEADFSNVKITQLPFDIVVTPSSPIVTQGQTVNVKVDVKIADGVTTGFSITQIYSTTATLSNLKTTAGTATDNKGAITWKGDSLKGTVSMTYTLAASATEKGVFTVATNYDDGKGFAGSVSLLGISIETVKPLELGIFQGYKEIGTATKGKVTHDGDEWAVIGSGSDIWNNSDGFEYLYLSAKGDFTFTIEKALIGGWGASPSSDDWQKMGIMARQSLNADSQHAFALLRKSDQNYMLQWRADTAGSSSNGGDTVMTPVADHSGKIMMKREGDTFSAYYIDSTGAEVFQNSSDIVMTDPIFVGVATTAHSDGNTSAGTFSKPVFKGTVVAPVGVDEWMMF